MAGDVVYFKGGTYKYTAGTTTCASGTAIISGVVLNKSGSAGNLIKYWAAPGERPVFDFDGIRDSCRIKGILVSGNYIHLKGLEIKGVRQNNNLNHESWGVWNQGSNNIFEALDVHHIMGAGIFIQRGSNNLVLNCDSHDNFDELTSNGAGESADGFGCHVGARENGMFVCTLRDYRDLARQAMPELERTGAEIRELSRAARGVVPQVQRTAEEYQGLAREARASLPRIERAADEVGELARDVRRNVPELMQTSKAIRDAARGAADLVPSVDHGPYLHEGSVIGTAQSVTMPQIGTVIDRLNRLLDSVPRRQTADVLHQLDAGLGGAGQDLGEVVDSSSRLVDAAQRQLRDTHDLISALDPVLRTQIGLRDQTAGYASSLARFTGALAQHDRQLRGLIEAGSPGLDEANGLIADLQPRLPSLLGNLATIGAVTRTYLPNLTQILVVYPATVARLQSAVNPRAAEGDVQLDLRATVNDPPSCITGYLSPTARRVPGDTNVRAVNGEAHCAVAHADPRSARGDRNLPCPNSTARAALPAGCGLDFGSGIAARSTRPTVDTTGAVREARARLEALRWMRALFNRTA